jgi:hypothetical protein
MKIRRELKPFPVIFIFLSLKPILLSRTLSNLFAKKNCYLFCITVTRIACSQAFLLLSFVFSFAHSPLGAAIKDATSFSSQEKSVCPGKPNLTIATGICHTAYNAKYNMGG